MWLCCCTFQVQDRLKQMLKKWSEGDFKNDPQLSLIPSLYMQLKRDGVDFNSSEQVSRSNDSRLCAQNVLVWSSCLLLYEMSVF